MPKRVTEAELQFALDACTRFGTAEKAVAALNLTMPYGTLYSRAKRAAQTGMKPAVVVDTPDPGPTDEQREEGLHWYAMAQADCGDLAAEYGFTLAQVIGATAALSPQLQWEANIGLEDMINEGVRRAYTHPDNVLRASIMADPAGNRKNTGDNTPAVIHTRVVPGSTVNIHVAAKGGGSEAKSKFVMLNPSDSVVDWVVETVPTMGAGWCPPGVLGIGVGGSAEKAMLLAKEALLSPIDIFEILESGPQNMIDKFRLQLYEQINSLGIGAQGLGGLTTVLDVKIKQYPTHAGALPVGLIPNCAATRHIHFHLVHLITWFKRNPTRIKCNAFAH